MYNRLKILITTVICVSVFVHKKLHAQEVDSLTLPVVVVTADISKEIIAPQRLTGKYLQQLNSFSVADAIRYFSGVQVKDYGGLGGLKTVNVRSLGAEHVGVFYNGIQLGNVQNAQVDLGKYSLDNVMQISLFNGQKTNLFQSAKEYAAASAIYIDTKRILLDSAKPWHLNTTLKTGSFGLIAPSVLWEQKLHQHYNLRINAEWMDAHGRYPFRYKRVFANGTVAYDTTAIRKNGDIRAFRWENVLERNFSKGFLNIHSYYYQSDRGLPGPIIKNVFTHGQRLSDLNFFIQSKYRNAWNKTYSMQLNAKYAYDFTHYLDEEPSNPIRLNNTYTQQEFYLSSINKIRGKYGIQYNISVDYQYNKMHSNLKNFSFPTRNTILSAIAAEWGIGNLQMQSSLLLTMVREQVRKNFAAPDRNILTPTFTVIYTPAKNVPFVMNGFYKRIFRMPTFNDLYYTLLGNAKLNPEYTTQYSMGFTYSPLLDSENKYRFEAKCDAYYNVIHDKIVAVPTGNMFRWMMLNIGKVQVKGLETSLATTINHSSNFEGSLRVSYTYQQALDVTDRSDKFYKHQILYMPLHSGSFIAGGNYKNFGIHYSFIYTGKRFNNKFNDVASTMQPWYTHDIGCTKDIYWRNSHTSIALEVNNVLNQYYDVVLNYPMPGRNYKLIIKQIL